MAAAGSDGELIPVLPVLLCGGSGTRLWPLSRGAMPKQFHAFGGTQTLLQAAARRLQSSGGTACPAAAPLVVAAEEHRFLVADQLRAAGVAPAALLLEPEGRNTAPALALAALAACSDAQDAVLVAAPTDHLIEDEAAFRAAIGHAVTEAASGAIVVLGVRPDRAETGYGYIEADTGGPTAAVKTVRRFIEKPDAESARSHVAAGNCFWNAGVFVVRASVWLRALERFAPDIATAVRASWQQRSTDGIFTRPGRAEFMAVRSQSVDYAVMERCAGTDFRVAMVELHAGWTDLGAWDAVWAALPRDERGNACHGDVVVSDSRDTLAHASGRLVALLGVDHLVVVETPDAVLVADKSRSQEVRPLVQALQQQGRSEAATPRKTQRPWGWYDVIEQGERFKVKHLHVEPGASLSLQVHRHRAEHWVVVRGTAEVTCGDRVQLLGENQSTYIAPGQRHRLANPGPVPLEVIEVQSGDYLGEDDIVRLDGPA